MKMDRSTPTKSPREKLRDCIKRLSGRGAFYLLPVSSMRFINEVFHFMLCCRCVYFSLYFAGCLNYVFVIISQVLWPICFPPRSASDISILNSFMYYPLSTDMHLSVKQTLALTVFFSIKGAFGCFCVLLFHFIFCQSVHGPHFCSLFLGYCATFIPCTHKDSYVIFPHITQII